METNKKTVQSKNKSITLRLGFWTFAWVMSIALVTFGSQFLWEFNTTLSLIMIILSTAIGVGVIITNRKYVRQIDELQRKILLDAMGIALGVAIIGGISYSMLDTTNVIANDAEISHLVILIGLTYLCAVLIGNARYK